MKYIKKYYHWIIAVVLFLVTAIRGGAANNISGLHLIPVTEAMDISRAQYSMAGSVSNMAAMLTVLFSGGLVLRYGHRFLLTVFLMVGAVAYAAMTFAEGYILWFAGYVLLGVANGICGEAGSTRLVSVWFHKHRGAVLGVVSSATGLGGSIMCIVQTAVMEAGTYRTSYLLVAILFAIVAVLTLIFVRSHPAKMGLLPYGDGEKITYKKREHEDHWHGFAMHQIYRRPTFYMMLIGTFLSCMLPYLAFFVVVPHLQDRGMSAMQASSIQSVLMLGLAGFKILAGYLCDRIGARKVALLCMSFDAVALMLLALTTGFAMSLAAVVIFSMGLPIVTIIIPLLASTLFGYQAQTEYNGIFIAMVSAASMVAGPLSNAFYDRLGTYSPVFLVAAALTVGLMGMYLLMYRLADKDRKNFEAEEAEIQR